MGKVLLVMIAMCWCYAGYFLISQYPAVSFAATLEPVNNRAISKTIGNSLPPQKPYDFYVQEIKARDLFTAPLPPPAAIKHSSIVLGQLPGNLKVVGILLGQFPQVIIEDTNMHQTYFIEQNKAQAGLKIQKTEQDKVFLNYEGQTIEIPLKGRQINVHPTI